MLPWVADIVWPLSFSPSVPQGISALGSGVDWTLRGGVDSLRGCDSSLPIFEVKNVVLATSFFQRRWSRMDIQDVCFTIFCWISKFDKICPSFCSDPGGSRSQLTTDQVLMTRGFLMALRTLVFVFFESFFTMSIKDELKSPSRFNFPRGKTEKTGSTRHVLSKRGRAMKSQSKN